MTVTHKKEAYRTSSVVEHTLKNPDTLLGHIAVDHDEYHVPELVEGRIVMCLRSLFVSLGIRHLVDELLANATDNYIKGRDALEKWHIEYEKTLKEFKDEDKALKKVGPKPLQTTYVQLNVFKVRLYPDDTYDVIEKVNSVTFGSDRAKKSRKVSPVKMDTDPKMDEYRVVTMLEVKNNGLTFPYCLDDKGRCPLERCFTDMRTSTNFDGPRKGKGKNGYGAKVVNMFSQFFEAKSYDTEQEVTLTCGDNMRRIHPIQVKKKKIAKSAKPQNHTYTRVRTVIDYARFVDPEQLEGKKPEMMRDKFDLSEADYLLLERMMYDMTGGFPSDLKVSINDDRIEVPSFGAYIKLFTGKGEGHYRKAGQWEIGLLKSKGAFESISTVNGSLTLSDGSHVTYLRKTLADTICERMAKGVKVDDKIIKVPNLKAYDVYRHFMLFTAVRMENPGYDGQNKNTLRTATKSLPALKIPDSLVMEICKGEIGNHLRKMSSSKDKSEMKKLTGKRRRGEHIEKYTPANLSGTAHSQSCTLYLCEGDSASKFIKSAMGLIGAGFNGLYVLRGKLINVGHATMKNLKANEEFMAMINILGLEFDRDYTHDISSLNYGSVHIATDADHDGDHICGLVMQMFHIFWPTLLARPGFLKLLATPIAKVFHRTIKPSVEYGRAIGDGSIAFYSMGELESWMREEPTAGKWSVKYYKGLGSSVSSEALWVFKNLKDNLIDISYGTNQDKDMMCLAFDKSRVDDRKVLVNKYDPSYIPDSSVRQMDITRFIKDRLATHFNMSNYRAIPSVCDGSKNVQRMILWYFLTCMSKKANGEFPQDTVVITGADIMKKFLYTHGDVSMHGAITQLGADFTGSNNFNVVDPRGNFGAIIGGIKDAGSARYISGAQSKEARLMYPEADDPIMKLLVFEGHCTVPHTLAPIISTVNGVDGIGTGYSTSIPNYKVQDVCQIYLDLLEGREPTEPSPCYRDINGGHVKLEPHPKNPKSYLNNSHWSVETEGGRCKVIIDRLRIGLWSGTVYGKLSKMQEVHSTRYAELEAEKEMAKDPKVKKVKREPIKKKTAKRKLEQPDEPVKKRIKTDKKSVKTEQPEEPDKKGVKKCVKRGVKKDYGLSKSKFMVENLEQYNSDVQTFILFECDECDLPGIVKTLRLNGTISTNNMVMYNRENELKRYDSYLDIVKEHYAYRYEMYEKRIRYLCQTARKEYHYKKSRCMFIRALLADKIVMRRKTDHDILEMIQAYEEETGFSFMTVAEHETPVSEDETSKAVEFRKKKRKTYDGLSNYAYLVNMPMSSVTLKVMNRLEGEVEASQTKMEEAEQMSVKTVWAQEVRALMAANQVVIREVKTLEQSILETQEKIEALEAEKKMLKKTKKRKR